MSHKILYLTLIVCAVVFFEETSAKGGVGKTSARRKIISLFIDFCLWAIKIGILNTAWQTLRNANKTIQRIRNQDFVSDILTGYSLQLSSFYCIRVRIK